MARRDSFTIFRKSTGDLGVVDRTGAYHGERISWEVRNRTGMALTDITFGNFSPMDPFEPGTLRAIPSLNDHASGVVRGRIHPDGAIVPRDTYRFSVFVAGVEVIDPEIEILDLGPAATSAAKKKAAKKKAAKKRAKPAAKKKRDRRK